MTEIFLAIFGLIIGSFINAAVYRVARNLPWVLERSHCVNCKHKLQPLDLVPIFSFLFLGGRCRYCQKKISWQYPIVEVVAAIGFLIAGYSNGFSINLFLVYKLIFVSAFIFIAVYDYKHFLILDKVIMPLLIVAIAWNVGQDVNNGLGFLNLHGMFFDGLKGAVLASGFFGLQYALSKGKWIGFGDVKYGLVLGMFFGFQMTAVCLFFAYLLGATIGSLLIIFKGKSMSSQVAFGSFLSVSGIITLGYGAQLIKWYLETVGV